MRKRAVLFMMIACCFVGVRISAFADAIWEPDNDFYQSHADECTYENRTYIVNGYGGSTDVYASPVSNKKLFTLDNGAVCRVYFSYTDKNGNAWALYDSFDGQVGWIPMAYLYPEYDSIEFQKDFKDQIIAEQGELTGVEKNQRVFGWPYPGAKRPQDITVQDNPIAYDLVFTDEEGHRWIHVGYYYGTRDFWMFEAQPDTAAVPLREIHQDIPTPPKSIDRAASGVSWPLVIGLVVAVVAITAILIHVFYPKKKV